MRHFSLLAAALFISLLLPVSKAMAQDVYATGAFHLEVPATATSLQATASYAGFVDVPFTFSLTQGPATVELVMPVVIQVAKKHQLKAYLRTARRQSRRSLRRL